ncbi:MAG: PASTA domain-containing protein [Acidimicrobiia bacterium]
MDPTWRRRRSSGRRASWIWLSLGLVLAGSLTSLLGSMLLDVVAAEHPEPEPARLVLPRVVGASAPSATASLVALGLEVRTELAQNELRPEGTVFAQSPVEGAKVAVGSTIVLQVSAGLLPVVPQVVAQQVDAARALLEGDGFAVSTVEVLDEVAPAGEVVAQQPAGGDQVRPGAVLTLVVSTGPPLRAVPDLRGLPQDQAVAALGAPRLVLGTVSAEPSRTAPAGEVLRSSPGPGTMVPPGTPVAVVVSSGPPPTVGVPSVIGTWWQDAVDVLAHRGLRVLVATVPVEDPAARGYVREQSPAGGELEPGRDVVLTVAV